MIIHQEREYLFQFRSKGVIVMKGRTYVGFFDTLEQALKQVFGG